MWQQKKKRVFFGFLKFFEAGSRIRPVNPGFQEDNQKRPKRTIPPFPWVFAAIPAALTNFRFHTQSSTQVVLKIVDSYVFTSQIAILSTMIVVYHQLLSTCFFICQWLWTWILIISIALWSLVYDWSRVAFNTFSYMSITLKNLYYDKK